MLVQTAEAFHYQPRSLNAEFFGLVYNEFLQSLDPEALILDQDDLRELESFRLQLDEQISNADCRFLEVVSKLFERKLQATKSLVESFKSEKINYELEESITYAYKPKFLSPSAWKDQWRKRLKLKVLSAYFASVDSGKIEAPLELSRLELLQQEVADREICRLNSRIERASGVDGMVGELFLKAVAHAYDPHTTYFSPAEESEFNNTLSAEALSFGFEVYRNDKGEVALASIMPGSPAWKSNSLNEGDVILAAHSLEGGRIDFSCSSLEEVSRFLSSDEIAEASFHFRKKNGSELQLSLHKEKVQVEENVIQSYILEGESKIGYIYLPSFYTDLNGRSAAGTGCALDVAKELIKLKHEGIEGLIFDLRNNGGGSMEDALKMVGIFINYGAIAIDAERQRPPKTLKDMERGTIFNAEMVVMINSFSASASELFAAAMQDQNRAVLVGSSSFGKATSQQVLPLDAYRYMRGENPDAEALAYLKLTIGAFYRVTGKSHQQQGVQPDIELPDIYSNLKLGESSYPSSLAPDSIDKKTYYFPARPLPLSQLRSSSAARQNADSGFARIKKLSLELPRQLEAYEIPLKFEEYRDFSFGADNKNWEVSCEHQDFTVNNPQYIAGMSSLREAGKELNENTRQSIQKDILIRESYLIIKDLINFSKN